MNIFVRKYTYDDIDGMTKVWNEVVREGNAFPQEEELDRQNAVRFFAAQTYCGAALSEDDSEVLGMYILHPNNVGRCGHICNASYAVASGHRGKHIGEALVRDCIQQARREGFKVLQFNAVVAANTAALKLYKKLGFSRLGIIRGGFRMPNGEYEDIIPHVLNL